MIEDEDDRAKRVAREKEEHQLHKLSKLAHSLKMDVHELKTMEENCKRARQELRLGHKSKEIVWRRRY
jgi:DNA repair exonuclease SbcCD ATPase subunit